jgi:4-carboxymuconolactone decarboxylase
MAGDPIEHRLTSVDAATTALVRLAAAVAAGDEGTVREALAAAVECQSPSEWVEEVLLQSYLFAGFPRALNAMREWRRMTPAAAGPDAAVQPPPSAVRRAGEATCRAVYGPMYEKLRENIRALHPALDEWMIVEGYGKVLSRPGLDLGRRELCIVAACVASGRDRRLHSHLHGSLNVGVTPQAVRDSLDALRGLVAEAALARAHHLLSRVVGV